MRDPATRSLRALTTAAVLGGANLETASHASSAVSLATVTVSPQAAEAGAFVFGRTGANSPALEGTHR
jgi:hypothetical protein